MVIYKSAEFPFEIRANNPIRTRLMTCTFGENFNFIRLLYIPRGGVQYLELAIQSKFRDQIKTGDLILEMPEFLSLVSPMDPGRRIPKPVKVTEEKIQREGKAYRRYTLTCAKEDTFDLGKLPPVTYMGFILEAASGKDLPALSQVYYHTAMTVGNDRISEPENQVPLHLLSPLKGKTPDKTIPIIDWSTPTSSIIVRLGKAEQAKLIGQMKQAGFNYKGLNEFGNECFSSSEIDLIRQAGLIPIKGLRLNVASPHQWTNLSFEDAANYLEKYPQVQAVTAEGKKLSDVICISHLIDADGTYRLQFEKWLGDAAKTYPVLFWDNEIVPANPNSVCFCEKCLENFKAYKHLSANITREEVLKAYKNDWIDFRCHQNSEIIRAMKGIIKKTNPDCQLWVYSGYQNVTSKNYYSMDWAYFAPWIDRALCGFGRPLDEISETQKALGSVPCTFGELIWTFEGRSYPMQEVRVNLFHHLIDSRGGGIMVYNDFSVDGRYYQAVSDIAALVSGYKDFFVSFKRDDSLAKVTAGELAVLVNACGERLVVIFNDSNMDKDLTLTHQNVSSGMKAIDAMGEATFVNVQSQKIHILANDILVIAVVRPDRVK
jgi:hypothetical protein